MESLSLDYIKNKIADSKIIYKRGESIFHLGNYSLVSSEPDEKRFSYSVGGSYGDYSVTIRLSDGIKTECSCPYPQPGCKHVVAVCLDLLEKISRGAAVEPGDDDSDDKSGFLTFEEIREEVLFNRGKAARSEPFSIVWGDTCKGEHFVVTQEKKEYRVILHDPSSDKGHCNCPDFTHNRLATCKHLIHVLEAVKKDKKFFGQSRKEVMPFIHVFWDSYHQKPRYYFDGLIETDIKKELDAYFDDNGLFRLRDVGELYRLISFAQFEKSLRFDDYVAKRVEDFLFLKEMFAIKKGYRDDYNSINATLYPYQKEGIRFCLFKTRAILADEMGLGKTIQAIAIAILKRDLFGFSRTLIVCPASLKEQWKREILRFTGIEAVIVSGGFKARRNLYEKSHDYFLITNYEAVMRDITSIRANPPDFIILDEAQRIKNFNTKTHQAILSIPKKQSLVITGTPLENKLEDLYSIVQFSDPELLSPFWIFSATYLKLSKPGKRICGYSNLDVLKGQLANLVIRRKKEEVLDSLPEQISNDYFVDLSFEQKSMHQGFYMRLAPLLSKKILTPFDIKMIQQLLLCMRMTCDSTFLIDEKTNISPKLVELENILGELVIGNKRKAVIFSEWTTMTYLIGKLLSGLKIPFVEFTGKIPVDKRQRLITEFESNPECMVFLSTDAGGVGLNLQAADCVINFELPWNPARLNQRIGRVNRIGQKSRCVNVVNLIAKASIEERVAAGIALKQELFNSVFDDGGSEVDFSQEKKASFVNQIRMLFGEEPVVPVKEDRVEIEEDTPYFLNPKALDDQSSVDFQKEEGAWENDMSGDGTGRSVDSVAEPDEANPAPSDRVGSAPADTDQAAELQNGSQKPQTDPAILEAVLSSGVGFLSQLSSMMSGKPLVVDPDSKAVSIDRETGEVTLKFRLPGFGSKG